jgi:hypothetical protein
VFTARYGLNPYIKQISFVFKGLIIQNLTKFSTLGLLQALSDNFGPLERVILKFQMVPDRVSEKSYSFIFIFETLGTDRLQKLSGLSVIQFSAP